MLFERNSSVVNAVTATGTELRLSSRRLAVTMISSSRGASRSLASEV